MLTDAWQWVLLMFPWLVPMLDGITAYQGWMFLALGAWGIHVAARRSTAMEKRNAIDSERRNDERYAKCVELLGNQSMATVLGAVHGLYHLAKEWAGYRDEVLETFCAYIRAQGKEQGQGGKNGRGSAHRNEVTLAMLRALGKMPKAAADLSGGKLKGLKIGKVTLLGANFSNSELEDVSMNGADIRGGIFQRSILKGVEMEGANLRGAQFCDSVIFRDVRIIGADMTDSTIHDVDMGGVKTESAILQGASLRGIRVSSENWPKVNFQGAKFADCRFAFVDFRGSDFRNSDLTGVEFQGSILAECLFSGAKGLTYARLESAGSLRGAQGLPPELEERLRREKPELFGEPPR